MSKDDEIEIKVQVDIATVLDMLTVQQIVDHIDTEDLLEVIGLEKAMEYWDLGEST